MTPEQIHDIIQTLTAGNRKKACEVIAELDVGNIAFWHHVQLGQWGPAADKLGQSSDAFKYMLTVAMLADMIWEG